MDRDENKRQQANGAQVHQFHGDVRADAMRSWRRIGNQLVALIGESGFCALFGRAMRMLKARYEWLGVEPLRSIDALLAALDRDLASVDGAVAAMAQRELLDTFIRQLATLIGEALTARLLAEVEASQPEGPDDAQEHK
jgi:hypothetical protein